MATIAKPRQKRIAAPSLAETIQSAVAKQITDELQGELSLRKRPRSSQRLPVRPFPKKASPFFHSIILATTQTTPISAKACRTKS